VSQEDHGRGRFRREFHPSGGMQTYKARVEKNSRGFGFLVLEGTDRDDVFLPPREVAQFFHGDRVEVKLNPRGDLLGVRLLEHRFKEATGRFEPLFQNKSNKRQGYLIFERKKTREEIFIPEVPANVNPGDWIQAKLQYQEGRHGVTGEITEVYGKELPTTSDIKIISSELGLKEGHTPAAIQQARGYGREVDSQEIKRRVDLRQTPFITIDGETARDFDDAVWVERNKSGFYLWVAIADVSHYVTEGSPLDQEAREKSTSVYFPERAFHMLPGELSEELCSLKPQVPRLAFVAKIEFDHRGKRGETKLMEAVIQSKRRATYNEIEAEFKENKKDWEYAPHFELYQLIRKQRSHRGSIDFEFPEAEIKCQPTGEVEYIRTRARLDAHRLIEEFMVSANEAVTDWMLERKWPFVFRVHEIPSRQALEKFQKLAKTVGFSFKVDEADSPRVLAELVRRFQGHPAETLLNISLLRSLKQAMYSSVHGIHYGLASEGYTHFTSPIRRYPDLIVHRLLRRALRVERGEEKFPEGRDLKILEKELAMICDHSSYRERLATDAERESIKLKQARLMAKHLGDEFEGVINGMIENGFFVRIDNPYVEGMVAKESMGNDYFQFKDDKMQFIGNRTRKIFKMGDRVKIRVLRSDIEKRTIDFGLVESTATSAKEESQDQEDGDEANSSPSSNRDRARETRGKGFRSRKNKRGK